MGIIQQNIQRVGGKVGEVVDRELLQCICQCPAAADGGNGKSIRLTFVPARKGVQQAAQQEIERQRQHG